MLFRSDRELLLNRLFSYSTEWVEPDKTQNDFYTRIVHRTPSPSEYCPLMRIVGLYPVFAVPTLWGTNQTYNIFRQWHRTPLEKLEVYGQLTVYAFPVDKRASRSAVNSMFASSRRNAFGFPELTPAETGQLASAFAPAFQQDVTENYDKIGTIVWQDNLVRVDSNKPAVYYYLSQAFIKGEPVLQMNYAVWYSARSGSHAPWLERGPLDGFTTRITFDDAGDPIMLDVANNCGCYHFFVPRKEKVLRVKSNFLLNPLVAAWLPQDFPQKHLALRINAGWHQVQHIDAGEVSSGAISYQLLPYEILESLPHSDGRTESVFNANGIMKDSKRIEPWFFFPSGIPHVGYMRQREHHPIKLVGQAYFEDPEILDRNFEFR